MSLDAPSPQDSQQLLLYKIAVATVTTSTNTPTADQRAALDAADAPSAENPFITASGLPAATTTTAGIVTLASVDAVGWATAGAVTDETLTSAGVSLANDFLATNRLKLRKLDDTKLISHELGYVSLDQIGSFECTFQIGAGLPEDTVVSRYGVGASNGDWRVGHVMNGESFFFSDGASDVRLRSAPIGVGAMGYGFEFSPYGGGSGNAALGADNGFLVGYGELGAQLATNVGSFVTADAQGVLIRGDKVVCALPSSAITALDEGLWSVAMDGSVPKLFYRPSGGALTSVSLTGVSGVTASNYTNLGSGITNATGLYSTVIGAGINAYGAQRLCVVSSNAVLTSSAAATGSTIVGDNTSVTGSSGNAAVFGRASSASDGGTALGGYALAKQYSVSVGSYTNGGAYSLSLGYNAGNGSSIANRTEIAPCNNNTITHRISGQTNGLIEMTTRQSDTAPTDATQAFGNADGTLPRGMFTVQLNAAGTEAKLYVNVGGTIKSATLALS